MFTLVGAPDEIVGKITTGDIDIAAVPSKPCRHAVHQNQRRGEARSHQYAGRAVHSGRKRRGCLLEDLKGKTLYASGQGATPEYVLNYILKQNGLDPEKDVTIVYKSEHAELASLMLAGEAPLAMLPEPVCHLGYLQKPGY